MDVRVELTLRAVALFISVFLTTRWYRKSVPQWDHLLAIFAIMLGVFVGSREDIVS